jgi:hypothetical protein
MRLAMSSSLGHIYLDVDSFDKTRKQQLTPLLFHVLQEQFRTLAWRRTLA